MINNFLQLITYFIVLFIGFIGTAWLIWSRFIRERTIREIPDLLVTEYRFWILLYICVIYLYVIKNLIRPKENSIFSQLASKLPEIIYKPLVTLDKVIKYKLLKNMYYDFTLFITSNMSIKSRYKPFIIVLFQIVPRGIMVLFLLADTFYFHRLAIFYKLIILGIFPLIYRYIKYSLKEIYEYYIELLEKKYDTVRIYEEDCKFDYGDNDPDDVVLNIKKSTAEHHNKEVIIKEYIEIKCENIIDWLHDKVNFLYKATPTAKNSVYQDFRIIKYKTVDKKKRLSLEDYEEIDKLFYDLIDKIVDTKMLLLDLSAWHNDKWIRYVKAGIFSLYFICWAYILIVSYKATPLELTNFKNIVINFIINLCKIENPFI